MKRQLTEWRKYLQIIWLIWVIHKIHKQLIHKIHKQLIQLNIKKKHNPIKNRQNRHFSKAVMKMANRHMKKWSTLLIIRKMQIKTTVRYHLSSVKMAIIKKKHTYKMLVRMWRKPTLYTIGGNVNCCSHCGKQYRGSSNN